MITTETSKKSADLMLRLMNAFMEEPVTMDEFKNQRAKEVKSNKKSYESSTGGLVPFPSDKKAAVKPGCLTSADILEVLDGEE